VAIVIGCMPMKPVNIAYTATFDAPVQQGTAVTFTFDNIAVYPQASQQRTTVAGNQATINLDPMNQGSRTLSVSVAANDVKVRDFAVAVSVPKNHINYTVARIPGNALAATAATTSTTSANPTAPATTPTDPATAPAPTAAATPTPAAPAASTSSFSLSQAQINAMQKAARQKSAQKAYLLLVLAVIYILVLARLTMLKHVAKPYFGLWILGAVLAVLFAAALWVKSAAPWQYRLLAGGLALALAVALVVNYWAGKGGEKLRKALILVDYGGILAFVALQFRLFTRHLGGFPDERTHLSYIAFMKMHGGWVPDFPAMRIYPNLRPGVMNLADDPQNTFNYLGHPPLYYKLMSLIGGMHIQGSTVVYDEMRLRLTSFAIGVAGLLLVLYIGFTRIAHIPMLHLLFVLIVISPANMIYGMSGFSNDTLLLLTVSVFILGVIRFMEERYDLLTYALIALGLSATMLTKLTGGLIVAVMTVLLVTYTLLVVRRPRRILRPAFYVTVPVYLIPAAYFALLHSRLHTIQPGYQQLAPKEFMSTGWYTPMSKRTPLTIAEYAPYFFKRLLDCWSSIVGYTPVARPGTTPFTIDAIGVTLIFLAPLAVFFFAKSAAQRYLAMGAISILVAVLYQFQIGFAAAFGRGDVDGGVQSRYYQCAMAFFALAVIWMIMRVFTTRVGDAAHRAAAATESVGVAGTVGTVGTVGAVGTAGVAGVVDMASTASTTGIVDDATIGAEVPAIASVHKRRGASALGVTRRLSSAGTAFVAIASFLLLYDGFISTFLLSGR
jgi:hypothetical protein